MHTEHIAEFDYTSKSNGGLDLSVRTPGSTDPFFCATITRIPLVSSLKVPFSSKLTGSWLTLVQPPLPQGDANEAGSEQWATVLPLYRGKVYVGKGRGSIRRKVGNGVEFPAVDPWSLVTVMENVDLDFGEASRKDMQVQLLS